MVPRLVFQAYSAFGTKALAVFPAHRLERQRGHDCVPQHRLKIDQIVLDSTLLFIVFPVRKLNAFIEEKFLHIDLKVIRKGIQASSAFALDLGERGSGYQNSFVYGLKPQVELDVRAFLNANERHTKITWCRYMFFECPHGSRAAPEVLDKQHQGRTCISLNENSCRTYDRRTILA
ncbi:hypothetical protein SAMN05216555_11243 [Arthrobacter cupressi]|uniref:Uncharacterized protein n=1 Tax=Arthrobacter cupressi TaxID=1045773 RepID=A0A1G8UP97_9MICC|nr:hypothetical protein SAMN05216555_11243 [Arthrobacter cupressi]